MEKQKVETFWNGVPAEARRCIVEVGTCSKMRWWCAELQGKRRAAVEVKYGGSTFFIDNDGPPSGFHQGQGWWKVTKGVGGPDAGHASLPDDCKVLEYLD